MYTFSENVQLSAADLDQASLGTQACEEREIERERGGGGGGLKGSAHFALQILVIQITMAACERFMSTRKETTAKQSAPKRMQGVSL